LAVNGLGVESVRARAGFFSVRVLPPAPLSDRDAVADGGGVELVQRVSGFQVEPGLFWVLDQEAVAGEPADDAPDETVEQTIEVQRVRRPDAMEPRAVMFHGVDPFQDQHVQVDLAG
jgi:hypothetical protein